MDFPMALEADREAMLKVQQPHSGTSPDVMALGADFAADMAAAVFT